MRTKRTLILIGTLVILLTSCDPTTYVTKKHNFKNNWKIITVVAPSYPFKEIHTKNDICISFPKQGEFTLLLSKNVCGGTYDANTEGYLCFTGTSCTEKCCQTEWDYYILTLIRKTSRYKSGDGKPLYLYIDNKNYIILEMINPE